MNAVEIVGWIGIAAAFVVMIAGINTILAALNSQARWKWRVARGIKQAAKLGWNTGEMADGTWFIALEWMKDYPKHPEMRAHYEWSVMQRRGNRVYTANDGMSAPVESVIGWIKVERWP